MVSKPKSVKAAETIAEHGKLFVLPHLCSHTTDPAVGFADHSEFFMQLDKATQTKVMAAKLEAEAAVHKAIADAHAQVATILKSRG